MSRSGYSEDYCENDWAMICWRGAVASAIKGKRGQRLLRDMLTALEAMPERKLIAHELVSRDGVCALGAVGRRNGMEMAHLDPEDRYKVAEAFGISQALVAEITWMNDDMYHKSDEQRHAYMTRWVREQLKEETP